jgi:hypothetical protein
MCFFVFPTVKGFFLKKFKKVNPFKEQTKVRKKTGILYILTQKNLYKKDFFVFFKLLIQKKLQKASYIRGLFQSLLYFFSL